MSNNFTMEKSGRILNRSDVLSRQQLIRTCKRRYIHYTVPIGYNILENRRRVMKKNVAILADSLPLSTSRHNTMFLKNWQHHLWVNFSCVLDTKQKQAASQQNQKGGRFWISQSDNSKTIITLVKDKHHIKGVIIILLILAIKS